MTWPHPENDDWLVMPAVKVAPGQWWRDAQGGQRFRLADIFYSGRLGAEHEAELARLRVARKLGLPLPDRDAARELYDRWLATLLDEPGEWALMNSTTVDGLEYVHLVPCEHDLAVAGPPWDEPRRAPRPGRGRPPDDEGEPWLKPHWEGPFA